MEKKVKLPRVLAHYLRSRGVDDVTQNAFGENIDCEDKKLLELYLKCHAAIKDLNQYIDEKYPEDEY